MEELELICRTCNSERTNLMDLCSNAPLDDSLKLRDVLLSVCPLLPFENNDGLPKRICYFCCKQLEIAYKFQLQCKKSYEDLCSLLRIPNNDGPQDGQSLLSANIGEVKIMKTEDEFQLDSEQTSTAYTETLEFLDDDSFDNELMDEYDLPEEIQKNEHKPQQAEYLDIVPSPRDEAPITCCHCDKKFFTTNGLRLHEKLTHKDVKPILIKAEILTNECKFCHQVFEKRTEMILHCRNEHKKEMEKEFTCNLCQKTFSIKTRFEHHKLYHSKNNFLCPVKGCKRGFIIRYKLSDHMRLFHGIALSPGGARSLKPVKNEIG